MLLCQPSIGQKSRIILIWQQPRVVGGLDITAVAVMPVVVGKNISGFALHCGPDARVAFPSSTQMGPALLLKSSLLPYLSLDAATGGTGTAAE